MKFQKKIIAAAIAVSCLGVVATAQAGTFSANSTTYAVEAKSTLGAVTPPGIAIQPSAVIAPNTQVSIYLQLDNAASFGTAYGTADVTDTSGASGAASAVKSVNNGTMLVIDYTTGNNGISTSNLLTFATATAKLDLSSVSATGDVKATLTIVNGPNSVTGGATNVTVPTSGVLDSGTGAVANLQSAVTAVVVPADQFASDTNVGTTTNNTQKIDVSAVPPFSKFTTGLASTTAANLGAVYITETAGLQAKANGTSDFQVTDLATVAFDIEGTFLTGTTGATVTLNTATNCTGSVATGTLNAAGTKVSFTGVTSVLAGAGATPKSPLYACYAIGAANTNPISESTFTIPKLNLKDATSTVNDVTQNASLMELMRNGASATLINYVPAAAAPYQTYVRVANNSSLAGDVTVTFIAADGSTLGTGTLASSMAANASQTFSPAEVEQAAGVTLAEGDRPQLIVSAVTPNIDVQAFLADPNGGFTNMTSNK